MVKKTLIGFGILMAVLSACQTVSQDPVTRGDVYFHALGCMQCHQIGNQGGTWGPNLTFIGFRKSPQWLTLWLKSPHSCNQKTVMPNFHLSQDELTSLVAYLSAQKGQAWTAAERPWNKPGLTALERGHILFNKAGCVACHGQDGRGGYPNNNVVGGQIPGLTQVSLGYSRKELIRKITNGVPQPAPADPNKPLPMIFMPSWGKVLSQSEISDVADYLLSLGPKPSSSADSF